MTKSAIETRSSEGLVRAIGRWSLAALTVNCIIGSGVFGLPSVLTSLVGRASILAVVLAAVAMAVIIGCFAEVASRFALTGGPYLYAQKAFGRFMGIQVAWLVWFVRLASCAANGNLFVTYLGEFWPGATRFTVKLAILTLLIGILAAPISLQEVCLYPKVKDSHVNKEIGVIPQAGCDLICDPVGTADVKERADPRRTTLRH